MATDKNILKNWFKTGLKPIQAQFWAWIDSYWHKDEMIPADSIDGLDDYLFAKADKATVSDLQGQVTTHKTATDAHQALFDLKQSLNQKGVAGGYVPLNEAVKIAATYLDIVNDLVTGGATSLASAETVKTLKTQIDGINTLLTSNDVNLDTVQELVDAIKTVQTSLSTILVNDLTTGGTTKALTAEMGKSLKTLVDGLTTAVAGKQATLVSGTNIKTINGTSLLGAGDLAIGVTRTLKTITSANLTTQDAAGFVAYINALGAPLVVANNEIVEYQLSDTGRVFKLLLGGRSFGSGQAAITATDVEAVDLWMDKDLKLSNYPSTRNDGQLPTNKVLAPDANGNIKLYSIATAPAPYLYDLIPDSYSPSNTGNFVLKGAFFTPSMTVAVQGQTVNYVTFISDNEVRANITTGSAEGSFDVTLNNGLTTVVNKRFLVVLGTVYKPTLSDWSSVTSNFDGATTGEAHLKIANQSNSAIWQKLIPATQNFRMFFSIDKSPLVSSPTTGYDQRLSLIKVSDLTNVYGAGVWGTLYTNPSFMTYLNNVNVDFLNNTNPIYPIAYEIRRVAGEVYVYLNGTLKRQFTSQAQVDMYIKAELKSYDIVNIKYVETT